MKSRKFIAVLAALTMGIAGCGGATQSDDGATEAQPSATEVQEDTSTTQAGSATTQAMESAAERGEEDRDTSGLTGEGTFSVNGEQTDTEWVVRCAPSDEFGGNPDERDLELVAYSSEGGFLTLNVGVEDLEGLGDDNYTYNTFELDWGQSVQAVEIYGFRTNPDGDWYFGVDTIQLARGTQTTDPLDSPPFTMEGDRIIGSVDIAAIDPDQPDGATVSFDLSIPPEAFDCSQL